MVLESNLILLFYTWLFQAPLIEETIFFALYILASFVKDKVLIGAWVYDWTFHLVSFIYVPVFVMVSAVLMTVAL